MRRRGDFNAAVVVNSDGFIAAFVNDEAFVKEINAGVCFAVVGARKMVRAEPGRAVATGHLALAPERAVPRAKRSVGSAMGERTTEVIAARGEINGGAGHGLTIA